MSGPRVDEAGRQDCGLVSIGPSRLGARRHRMSCGTVAVMAERSPWTLKTWERASTERGSGRGGINGELLGPVESAQTEGVHRFEPILGVVFGPFRCFAAWGIRFLPNRTSWPTEREISAASG